MAKFGGMTGSSENEGEAAQRKPDRDWIPESDLPLRFKYDHREWSDTKRMEYTDFVNEGTGEFTEAGKEKTRLKLESVQCTRDWEVRSLSQDAT